MTCACEEELPTANCSECGAIVKAVFPTKSETGYFQVDRGLCLDLTGHYGGFNDDIRAMFGDEPRYAILCHDCSLRVFQALPNFTKNGLGMNHPAEFGGGACCEYGYDPDNCGPDSEP